LDLFVFSWVQRSLFGSVEVPPTLVIVEWILNGFGGDGEHGEWIDGDNGWLQEKIVVVF